MKYAFILFGCAAALFAQSDRLRVPLSDPNRPATVRVDSMHGDILVRATEAREVTVGLKESEKAHRRPPRRPNKAEAEGLRRIELGSGGFTAEERENVVTVNSGMHGGNDLLIEVPRASHLKLKTMGGEITVEGVSGDIEATSMNGEVTMTSVEGAVVAHSLNGAVKVALSRVEGKPMSFSTMNGDIDVTLPPDVKARFKLKNDRGDVYTDFEMKTEQVTQTEKDAKGKIRIDRTVYGNVNGGGPEISFRTVNGEIKIRRRK